MAAVGAATAYGLSRGRGRRGRGRRVALPAVEMEKIWEFIYEWMEAWDEHDYCPHCDQFQEDFRELTSRLGEHPTSVALVQTSAKEIDALRVTIAAINIHLDEGYAWDEEIEEIRGWSNTLNALWGAIQSARKEARKPLPKIHSINWLLNRQPPEWATKAMLQKGQ